MEPDPANEEQRARVTDRAEAQVDRERWPAKASNHRAGRADRRAGPADHRRRDARGRSSRAAAPPPLDPAQAGRRAAAPPTGQPPHRRQDLHRAGRQDLPPVDVHHANLPELRPGLRGRSTRRPGHLRLSPRRPRRAGLRRAIRPVHPEPAPVRRPRHPVLRRHRTAATARPARPHRHPRHHLPRRTPRGHRRDLPPGLVALHTGVKYDGGCLPVWDEHTGTYLDPDTGEVLPTWDQALDAIGDQDEPRHVARFGAEVRRPGRARRITGRQPVHRLPHQVPDQAPRRLPPGGHRRPGRPRRPARRRAALRAVLTDLRELAPLRHPAQATPGRA